MRLGVKGPGVRISPARPRFTWPVAIWSLAGAVGAGRVSQKSHTDPVRATPSAAAALRAPRSEDGSALSLDDYRLDDYKVTTITDEARQ